MKFKDKTLTNSDRMRSMSDEEIAKFLTDTVADGCPPGMNWDCRKDECGWDGCEECWKLWLSAPACAEEYI